MAWEGEGAKTSGRNFRFVPCFANTAPPCAAVLPRVLGGMLVWFSAFVRGAGLTVSICRRSPDDALALCRFAIVASVQIQRCVEKKPSLWRAWLQRDSWCQMRRATEMAKDYKCIACSHH